MLTWKKILQDGDAGSGSFLLSGSTIPWANISNKPPGLVSGSVQIASNISGSGLWKKAGVNLHPRHGENIIVTGSIKAVSGSITMQSGSGTAGHVITNIGGGKFAWKPVSATASLQNIDSVLSQSGSFTGDRVMNVSNSIFTITTTESPFGQFSVAPGKQTYLGDQVMGEAFINVDGVAPGIIGSTVGVTFWFTTMFTLFGNLNVTGTITGSIAWTNLTNKPTLVSGSSQILYSGISGKPTGIYSSSNQIKQFTAPVTMSENVTLSLTASLSADGKYNGIIERGIAGATVAFGDLLFLSASNSRWVLTDADTESKSGGVKLGMCIKASTDGNPTSLLLFGKIRADSKFPTMTIGAPVYASTSSGLLQISRPNGTDDVIRIVGYGNTADELYFTPSNDWMTSI